jgi:riboflavin kinase/FMN adenylyltransferase
MAILRFNDDLVRWEARTFVEEILVKRLSAKLLIASGSHTIGFDRAGLDRITVVCREFGIEVYNSPILQLGELKVSSTEIRRLLWEGRVEEAAGLLGRHYSMAGTVISGRGQGRQLGYPTANLTFPPDKLIPADGVYAAVAYDETDTARQASPFPAAVSIGNAPTFGLENRLVEAHLLTDLSLVGHTLRLDFIRRLRGQQKFAGEEELSRQIALDVEQTRHLAATVLQTVTDPASFSGPTRRQA